MARMEWTPECSVSVQRFDREHKRLFALVNDLDEAVDGGRGEEVISRTLAELTEYARRHFAGEEEAMRRAAYAGLEAHMAEHRQLAEQVAQYSAEWMVHESANTGALLEFLRNWLQHHVLECDRSYGPWLNRAGIY